MGFGEMNRRRFLSLGGLAAASCVASLSSRAQEAQGSKSVLAPLVGKAAPPFDARTLDGKLVSLRDYRGRAVLINFWATWCGNCLIEMPWLAHMREKYASQGFEVLGILTNEAAPGKLQTLIEKAAVKYPILKCNHTIAQAYGGLPYLPASFYVNRRGVLISQVADAGSKEEVERNIRAALHL